jgi:arginine utilization protein RocB
MNGVIDARTRTRDFALRLTQRRSINGTSQEGAYAAFLKEVIEEIPYFRANPADLWIEPVPNDPLRRGVVLGLVRGQGPRTVILTGHFDTIGTKDYDELEQWATEPADLTSRIVERLTVTQEDRQALDDLKSGRFLAGRGLLDMKSGLAAGLAVVEAFASQDPRAGNLLFVAVPDEEDSSVGMRFIAPRLAGIANERGISLSLAINLDAAGDEGEGNKGQTVALGTIGKTLLSAYIVGQETHACYPFDGLSASLLAAELVQLMECSPEFTDDANPPPATLAMRDLKGAYNVTTPSRAWCSWNIISHSRKSAELLTQVLEKASEHLRHVVRRLTDNAEKLNAADSFERIASYPIKIFTYEGLLRHISAVVPTFHLALGIVEREIAAQTHLDLPTRAQKITEFVWRESGLTGPAVIFGFASMPYPATKTLDEISPFLLRCVARAASEVSDRHKVKISLRDRLEVIADMSFLGPIDPDDLKAVAANTPIWRSSIQWEIAKAATPALPTINAGPWGRGYHRWLERVEVPYAFAVLPDLLMAICQSVLCSPEEQL